MAVYEGKYYYDGADVTRDGAHFDHRRSLQLRDHSPTGFNWGYGGSGPAQLALALLLEEVGEEVALDHYQSFKWQVVAHLPSAWTLTSKEIQVFLAQKKIETMENHLS